MKIDALTNRQREIQQTMIHCQSENYIKFYFLSLFLAMLNSNVHIDIFRNLSQIKERKKVARKRKLSLLLEKGYIL